MLSLVASDVNAISRAFWASSALAAASEISTSSVLPRAARACYCLSDFRERRLALRLPANAAPQSRTRSSCNACAALKGIRFAGVLAATAIDPNRDDTWYSGRRDWVNDPQGFSTYLGSRLRETVASASTPPGSICGSNCSSSGCDGGGSSGGGSGW